MLFRLSCHSKAGKCFQECQYVRQRTFCRARSVRYLFPKNAEGVRESACRVVPIFALLYFLTVRGPTRRSIGSYSAALNMGIPYIRPEIDWVTLD